MKKLYFEGNSVDLYAADYQYLQDSISDSIINFVRTVFTYSEVPSASEHGILYGFLPEISLTNPSQLRITHSDGVGSILSENGIYISSGTIMDGISLSSYDPSTTNYIYAKCTTALGSYNRSTKQVVLGEKRGVDFSTYQSTYNRQEDVVAIVVLTLTEWNALSAAEKKDYVLLGTALCDGLGEIISIDLTVRRYLHVKLGIESIQVSNLAPSFMLPQFRSLSTSTGKMNDNYYQTPSTLEDDLNRLRTEIRGIKGTATWQDPPPGTLLNVDKSFDKLHLDGIVEYGDNLATSIITSSGSTYIRLGSGKLGHLGNVYALLTPTYHKLNDVPSYYKGNWIPKTYPEIINFAGQPSSHQLSYAALGYIISTDDFHICDSGNLEYTRSYSTTPSSGDYYLDVATGTVTSIVGGNISYEDVEIYYKYSNKRYDTLYISSTGALLIAEGAITQYPEPPSVPSGSYILCNVLRIPFQQTSTGNIVNALTEMHNVRECVEITSEDLSTCPYSPFKNTYFLNTGLQDSTMSQWTLSQSSGKWLATSSTIGSFVESYFLVKENGELWIRATRGPDAPTLTVQYESVPGSSVLDQAVTLTLDLTEKVEDCLFLVAKGLYEGYHKVKITTVETPTGNTTFEYFGLVCGNLDTLYTQKATNITSELITDKIQATGRFLTTAQIQSKVATGTAPFTVDSTTKVTNLNADLLDSVSSEQIIYNGQVVTTLKGSQLLTDTELQNCKANGQYICYPVNSSTGLTLGYYYHITHHESNTDAGYSTQWAKRRDSNAFYVRQKIGGTWGNWVQILTDTGTSYRADYLLSDGVYRSATNVGTTVNSIVCRTSTGEIQATSFDTVSKRSEKKNIEPYLGSALDAIDKIQIVKFFFKQDHSSNNLRVGFIADDTDPIFSGTNKDKMDLANGLGMIFKAIQEINDILKKRNY